MNCSYCGLDFDETCARHQCQGCLVASGCRSVRCPRCGYEMPEEIQFFGRVREWKERLLRRFSMGSGAPSPKADAREAPGGDAPARAIESPATISAAPVVSLAEMRPGESGVVVDLRAGDNGQVEKCLALGILPGATITLHKRSPSFIFDIGFSQFAVDEGMAGAVLVKPDRA